MRSLVVFVALVTYCGWAVPVQGQVAAAANEGSPAPFPPQDSSVPAPEPPCWFPYRPAPGWFAGGEVALLTTHVSHLEPLFFGGSETEPVNDLGLNGSPRGIFGYHFAGGNALLASYRFLSASGDATNPNPAHASFIYNTLDLDYQGRIHGPWLGFTAQWQTGIRFDDIHYNTAVTEANYRETEAQRFLGAGPHFGLNLAWYAGRTGLNCFARGDLCYLVGSTRVSGTSQYIGPPDSVRYLELLDAGIHSNPPSSSVDRLLEARAEIGLGWVLPTSRWMRVEGGYLIDDFIWSEHIFTNFGPFLRYEVGF